MAALQVACATGGLDSERDVAETSSRDRRRPLANPNAQVKGEVAVAKPVAEPYLANPLRKHRPLAHHRRRVGHGDRVRESARQRAKRPV